MKKIINVLLSLLIVFTLVSCSSKQESIIIVYTNDVHAAVNENIGYAGLVSYVNELKQNNKYVTLVDAGDAYQGTTLSSVSKGEAVAEILKYVDYDIMTFGNHEFDYGMEQLVNLMKISDKEYINSNIVYKGNEENNFMNDIKKYEIITYGKTKVGYVAFDTPYTTRDSIVAHYMEDDEIVYNFCFGEDKTSFYDNAQKMIDEVKKEGVDYVVAICHFGQGEGCEGYTSTDLANATSGIDVIIDAHSHLELPCQYETNKDGKEVLITCSGTALNNIGQVVIGGDGYISTTNINNYTKKDEATTKVVDEVVEKYTAALDEKLFVSDIELSIADEDGIRMIRSREMPLGNLIADALRYYADADIAIINSGAIRNSLHIGDLTYNDFINVLPLGNDLVSIEVTGQELADYLEYSYAHVESEYVKDSKANGEFGSFMQVSGIRFTVDTSVKADIEVDENDNFLSIGETRRLKDIEVLNDNGQYEPLDPNKTYVLGGITYILLQGGSGTEAIFKDNTVISNGGTCDYEAVVNFVKEVLNGDLSLYKEVDNRISIK